MNKHLDLDALQAAAWMRNVAGIQLANIAFNWAQQPGYMLTSDDCELLRALYKQWDAKASAIPDIIDRLRKAEAASKWISVDERLPEIGQGVIAYRPTAHLSNDPPITITFFAGGERNESWQGVRHGFDCLCHPSHWMPLPAAPTSADSEGEKG